jgi:hypothetical protein
LLQACGTAECGGGECRFRLVNAGFAAGGVEEGGELFGEDPFPAHAGAKIRVVEFTAANCADRGKHLLLAFWHVLGQPFFKQRPDRVKNCRIYFEKKDGIINVLCILNKNTLKDFFFRSKLPISEDQLLQEDPKFWQLVETGGKK